MILRYLIEKEFRQLKRNSFLPRLIVLFPCMMMLVMPWAATLEIEDLRIAVIDNDHSLLPNGWYTALRPLPTFS